MPPCAGSLLVHAPWFCNPVAEPWYPQLRGKGDGRAAAHIFAANASSAAYNIPDEHKTRELFSEGNRLCT